MVKNFRYLLYGVNFLIKRNFFNKKQPFIAGLVLGESCNLNCKHCSVSNKNRKNDLSFKEIEAGLKILYKKGIRLLAITGGEPFIWHDKSYDLENVIKLSKKIGFLITSVYTNGTVPIKTQANDVFVSIDGLKNTTSKLRGDVYDLVINNIKKSKHPNILINCTINNKNKNEIESLCKFVSKIDNVKGIFFYFHTPYYGKDKLFIPFVERKKIILELIKLKKKYKILNSTSTLWSVYHDNWQRPSNLCLVFANNKIYECCRSVGNEEICRECGYLGYPEIENITKLKGDAVLSAMNYLPKK